MVNNPVISAMHIITDCSDEYTINDIPTLIKQLEDPDGFIRMHARHVLICIGKSALPELINALSGPNSQLRWQIIKVLEGIQDTSAARALVECLKDENAGVRWAASDALISLHQAGIPPLLEALMRDIDSIWLRQGAHHILHVIKDAGRLHQAEEKVFEALEDVEPTAAVPWAAEKALEAIRHKKT